MCLRRWLVGGLAALVAVPAGFAVAQTAAGGGKSEDRLVPAAECGDQANAAWQDAGMPRESYYPRCPTAQEASEQAQQFNENRRRALTAISAAIKRYGDSPEDEAELQEIEAELQRLDGPLGHPYAARGE
jgi:hypothetical protein